MFHPRGRASHCNALIEIDFVIVGHVLVVKENRFDLDGNNVGLVLVKIPKVNSLGMTVTSNDVSYFFIHGVFELQHMFEGLFHLQQSVALRIVTNVIQLLGRGHDASFYEERTIIDFPLFEAREE